MLEPMKRKRYVSVWDAIEKTPAQAENLKLRSSLMLALKRQIEREGLSQTEAAKVFGVTQPRISDLMRGKIELFGIDMLVNMLAAAGLRVRLQVKKASPGTLKGSPSSAKRAGGPYKWRRSIFLRFPPNCAPAASASTAAATCLRR
jgi:predicted XRE-type DNA-binding protein